MTVISISEAARTWRLARSTLQRALQEGRLSATVRADGSRGIDTAELIRVFGEAPGALQERGSSEVERATPSGGRPDHYYATGTGGAATGTTTGSTAA